MFRTLFAAAVALGLAAWPAGPAVADEKGDTHEGTVVKAEGGKLTMTAKGDDKEHEHAVAPDAKITCDGKECKLDDLMKGYKVKVTTEKRDEKAVATKIEAQKAE